MTTFWSCHLIVNINLADDRRYVRFSSDEQNLRQLDNFRKNGNWTTFEKNDDWTSTTGQLLMKRRLDNFR